MDNPTRLIPFWGAEQWSLFEQYCQKINKKPVDVISEYINYHANVIKTENSKKE